MLREERLKAIMREINLHNKVLSADLSASLNVSEDTIRRDLRELAEEGLIVKVHGGAMNKAFHYPFEGQHEVYAQGAKQVIADKIIPLLKNNMSILVEGGTTIIEIAKKIPESLHVTFFTLSPQVAITLAQHEHLEVVTIGGRLTKHSNLHTGASVVNQLADIRVDLCVIGANAISAQDGVTDSDWEVVQVIKAVIRSSKKVAVVCIAEKLNTVQRMKVCDINRINYLFTELSPDNPLLAPYRSTQLTVI
jgi:DeoR/GlpR family transcriptional regulator of sugar metabolism